MYNNAHLYDLSFVSPNRRLKTKPQLVFTIDERHFAELQKRLALIASKISEESYLDAPAIFWPATPDLFGRREFGYRRCGFVTKEAEAVSLRIELDSVKLHAVALTIKVLTTALLVPFDADKIKANRTQQIDIETCCVRDSTRGYGHAVSGYASTEVVEWLKRVWQKGPSDNWLQFTPMPEEVTAAMRQAFSAIVPKHLRKWTKECGGSITEDGRFMLGCFGNACDLAIYPDNFHPHDGVGVPFSCHNLDNAFQQITLLAGLAKLCELARADNQSRSP